MNLFLIILSFIASQLDSASVGRLILNHKNLQNFICIPSNYCHLSLQYKNMKFRKQSNSMSIFLLAEKHQQLLLKNAKSYPTREVHATILALPGFWTNVIVATGCISLRLSTKPPKGVSVNLILSYASMWTEGRPMNPKSSFLNFHKNCYKSGKKCHYTREYCALSYLVNMYIKLQQLRN